MRAAPGQTELRSDLDFAMSTAPSGSTLYNGLEGPRSVTRASGSITTPSLRRRIVLLPAYNESAGIEHLLQKLATAADRSGRHQVIIACDDGSSDATPEILARLQSTLPLEVITHKLNRGLGESVRDLFERAAEIAVDDDVIVRLDCDNTHEPEYLEALTDKLADGYDVVIASRFAPSGGQVGLDGYRTFVSRCANVFMKTLFPISGVREYSCGYRAYRATIVKRAIAIYGNNFIQLRGLGFTCTLEKLVKLKLLGARCAEVPFVLHYERKLSSSKMVGSVTTLGYVVMTVLYYWPWGGWRRQAMRRAIPRHAPDQPWSD